MSIILPDIDKNNTINRYTSRYQKFGYSPKSLGWDKGKQDVRFDVLTSQYDFRSKSVLDIGCGFGDLNNILINKFDQNYTYTGIDLVPELLKEAKRQYSTPKFVFLEGDFLATDLSQYSFDYAIASGIFNQKLSGIDNYEVIETTIERALNNSNDGIAFDFLSDKVDFQLEHTFHSSPEKILSIAYKYSKNITLRSDYMPFEFAIFIFKDDSFSRDDTLFNRYKSLKKYK